MMFTYAHWATCCYAKLKWLQGCMSSASAAIHLHRLSKACSACIAGFWDPHLHLNATTAGTAHCCNCSWCTATSGMHSSASRDICTQCDTHHWTSCRWVLRLMVAVQQLYFLNLTDLLFTQCRWLVGVGNPCKTSMSLLQTAQNICMWCTWLQLPVPRCYEEIYAEMLTHRQSLKCIMPLASKADKVGTYLALKDMPKMAPAVRASYFSPDRAKRAVYMPVHSPWHLCIEGWPATSTVKLGIRPAMQSKKFVVITLHGLH